MLCFVFLQNSSIGQWWVSLDIFISRNAYNICSSTNLHCTSLCFFLVNGQFWGHDWYDVEVWFFLFKENIKFMTNSLFLDNHNANSGTVEVQEEKTEVHILLLLKWESKQHVRKSYRFYIHFECLHILYQSQNAFLCRYECFYEHDFEKC